MIRTAAVFSDNMVLQRGKNVRVFGTGDSETVTVSINGVSKTEKIRDGKWMVVLPAMSACDNLTMTVTDGIDEIKYENVSIGEVWLAGGQSNIELELQFSKDGMEYLSEMTPDMPVRFFYTNKSKTLEQAYEAEKYSRWGVCDKEGSRPWSAVGYHFAKKVAKELGVTVGIIGCNWGGTSATCWLPEETISDDKELDVYIRDYTEKTKGKTVEELVADYKAYEIFEKEYNEKTLKCCNENPGITWDEVEKICGKSKWPGPMAPTNPFRAAGLYETMLKRVCPYTIKGFLYYQGESDDHRPKLYYKLLTRLINKWRTDWEDDELDFEIVQLPMFKYKNDPDYKHWCLIREAQMKAYKTVKNTGITVITDCGEFDNIHPVDKKPVGDRLALQALYNAYNLEVDAYGPIYKSVYFDGNKAEITFYHAEQGFAIAEDEINGFEIAGDDKKFVTAKAEICGDKIVVSGDVDEARYVRYDWYNWIEPSVFGKKTGIPLAPFRTSCDDE